MKVPVDPPRFVLGTVLAACRGVDPEVFFPAQGKSGAEAKAVCRECLLRVACDDWALDQPEVLTGVWGGRSARERRALKRERR